MKIYLIVQGISKKNIDYIITKMKKILFDFINNEDLEEHLDNIKFYKTQLSNKHYQEILNYIKNNKLWIWIKNIY